MSESETYTLEIEEDGEQTGQNLAILLQKAVLGVVSFYEDKDREIDGANAAGFALAMLTAYCAMTNIDLMRRTKEACKDMNRAQAGHLYMSGVFGMARSILGEMIASTEGQEADDHLRSQEPMGEA